SVGKVWGKHWGDAGLARMHGERIQYLHEYPDYFPQAASNPQTPWAYPDGALPEFRRWIREVYVPNFLPTFLSRKEREGYLPRNSSVLAIAALEARNNAKRIN